MRHLLGGVALAALLAAGLPAAAQTNDAAPPAASGQNSGMSGNQGATSGATTPESGAKHKKHAAKHKAMKNAAARHTSPADNMAEQLNREELEKVQQNSSRMPASGSSTTPGAGGADKMPQQ